MARQHKAAATHLNCLSWTQHPIPSHSIPMSVRMIEVTFDFSHLFSWLKRDYTKVQVYGYKSSASAQKYLECVFGRLCGRWAGRNDLNNNTTSILISHLETKIIKKINRCATANFDLKMIWSPRPCWACLKKQRHSPSNVKTGTFCSWVEIWERMWLVVRVHTAALTYVTFGGLWRRVLAFQNKAG